MIFTYAAILFDRGQRSIVAWYFMFSICFFSASLSMAATTLGSISGRDQHRQQLARSSPRLRHSGDVTTRKSATNY